MNLDIVAIVCAAFVIILKAIRIFMSVPAAPLQTTMTQFFEDGRFEWDVPYTGNPAERTVVSRRGSYVRTRDGRTSVAIGPSHVSIMVDEREIQKIECVNPVDACISYDGTTVSTLDDKGLAIWKRLPVATDYQMTLQVPAVERGGALCPWKTGVIYRGVEYNTSSDPETHGSRDAVAATGTDTLVVCDRAWTRINNRWSWETPFEGSIRVFIASNGKVLGITNGVATQLYSLEPQGYAQLQVVPRQLVQLSGNGSRAFFSDGSVWRHT